MGGRTLNRGVRAKGSDRIEFEFVYQGKRYRPSLIRVPSETNLRRAAEQLRNIKVRIKFGTFNFKEEFPDYRLANPPVAPSDPGPVAVRPLEEERREVKPGEAIGNFDEFRFFTGLRQSEQISLRISDCDLTKGTIHIHQVVVLGRHKDRPKNNEERTVELCPRALSVLNRQLVLRERHVAEGKIHHDHVFFKDDGEPISSLQYVYGRWCSTIDRLAIRYRPPYNARHSCVSWHLMIGKNLLWCSTQFGHSVQVMLTNYGRWISGATDEDVRLIGEAIAAEAIRARVEFPESPAIPWEPQKKNATTTPLEKGWGRLSLRKVKYFNHLTGGADGTRTRDPRRDRPVF